MWEGVILHIVSEPSTIVTHIRFLEASLTSRQDVLGWITKPVPPKPEQSSTDWVPYFVALVAACVGSILTIAGELAFRIRDEKAIFENGKRQLLTELRTIFRESGRRANAQSAGFPNVTIDPPLPRSAWTTLILSGQLRRLNVPQIEALNDFYREVESVNIRAAQVPILLQTVALSTQSEVQVAFMAEAERVSTAPYADLIARQTNLEQILGETLK